MVTVLCYGDSNTFGYIPETGMRYSRDIRYPGRLQKLLGDDYAVIEEGCNGRTTIHDDPVDGWKNGLDYSEGRRGLMNTFICYDRCTTCKKAQKWLDTKGVEYKVRPIKEKNPTAAELAKWIKKSGKEARKFFNTSGQLYREMGLSAKLKDMSEQEMIDLLATDGMLVKRPLLITDSDVLVGFKESEWEEKVL